MVACSPQNFFPLATTILQYRFFFSTKNAHLPGKGAAMLEDTEALPCYIQVPNELWKMRYTGLRLIFMSKVLLFVENETDANKLLSSKHFQLRLNMEKGTDAFNT